jgi:hypothetical protein
VEESQKSTILDRHYSQALEKNPPLQLVTALPLLLFDNTNAN